MKKSTVAALAALAAVSMCGCGAKTEETKAPAEQAQTEAAGKEEAAGQTEAAETGSGEQVELKFSWWGGDSRHEATEKAIAAFMEKYPNIKVTAEYGAWSGWEEKQSLNLLGGNAADVMQINWNWIDSYSQGGSAFANLEDYADVLDLTQFPQESLDLCKVNDKLMAVPVALTGRLFYWNKSTFEEVGCPIPTDTESLLAAGAAFKAYNEEYYPMVLQEYDRAIFLVYYLESVYNKPWVADGQLNYTAEEIQEGLDFICKLEAEHVIPTLTVLSGDMADSIDKNAKWIDGKYAGIFEWDSAASKMKQAMEGSVNKPNQEMVLGEFVKFGEYQGGFTKISMGLAVPASSAHPKEAAMLINFLLNEEEGIEISSTERGIPCSAAAVKLLEEKGIGDALTKEANAKVIDYSKFPLDSKFEHNDLKANPDGVYYKVFGKLSAGEIDPAAAAQELMDGVTECLEN